jgi:hypothetical protein
MSEYGNCRMLIDPRRQLFLVAAIHADLAAFVPTKLKAKLQLQQRRQRLSHCRTANPSQVISLKPAFERRWCAMLDRPTFSGCNADIEKAHSVTFNTPVPRRNREASIKPPSIDAVRDRLKVDEVQYLIRLK